MILDEKQIKELKERIELVKLPNSSDGIKIGEIYSKINRTNYEHGLLFFCAYDFLRTVGYDPLKEIIGTAKKIGESNEFFNEILRYPDCVIKATSDAKIGRVLIQNRDFLFDLINLVFGRLLVKDSEEGEEDIYKQIEEVSKE